MISWQPGQDETHAINNIVHMYVLCMYVCKLVYMYKTKNFVYLKFETRLAI